MLFFHGTKQSSINQIVEKGLYVDGGRATFSTNPEMTLSYADIGGGIFIFRDNGNFHIAKDSDIKFNRKSKEIVGWINRYKNEQFGYYHENNDRSVPSDLLIGAFVLNSKQHNLLKEIKFLLRDGKLKRDQLKNFCNRYSELLDDREIQIIKPQLETSKIAQLAIEGLIRNLSLLQVRTLELSYYANNGWKINNLGDHEVRLYNSEDFHHRLLAIQEMIEEKLIDDDIVEEYNNLIIKIKESA